MSNLLKQNRIKFIRLWTIHLFMAKNTHKKEKSSEKTKNLKKVDAQDSEVVELRTTLQRVQAEFENYQKRTDKEMADFRTIANANMMTDLLPVLDTLEQGLIHNQEFASVQEQLESILKKKGLEKIQVESGMNFDHDKMECLMEENVENIEDGKVVKVLINGYMLGGKILRHAKVSLNKIENEETQKEKNEVEK